MGTVPKVDAKRDDAGKYAQENTQKKKYRKFERNERILIRSAEANRTPIRNGRDECKNDDTYDFKHSLDHLYFSFLNKSYFIHDEGDANQQ